jgi:ComF family protein
MIGALFGVADALASVLFSSPCVVCGTIAPQIACGAVCDACWRTVPLVTPPVCQRCGDPLTDWTSESGALSRTGGCSCALLSNALDRVRALGPYESTLRTMVHALKYDRRRSIAGRLAQMAVEQYGAYLDADAVVPVPLHRHRQWSRGFNQTEELARHLGLPVWRVLRRVRDTRPQSDLSASERLRNVRHAFAVRPLIRCRCLTDASVILLDDVSTTGATLGECAEVLKAAGVREVRALTIARTLRYRQDTGMCSADATASSIATAIRDRSCSPSIRTQVGWAAWRR